MFITHELIVLDGQTQDKVHDASPLWLDSARLKHPLAHLRRLWAMPGYFRREKTMQLCIHVSVDASFSYNLNV